MSGRFSLVGQLGSVSQGLRLLEQDLSGAKSPEIRAAAKALRKHVARVLNTSGGARVVPGGPKNKRKFRAIGGTPSRPGQPPRRQTGNLRKSVRQGPVATGRRIAVMWFTGQILEQGVDTSTTLRSGRRRRRGGVARRQMRIAARPFMARALANAQSEMVGVVASLGEARALRAGA